MPATGALDALKPFAWLAVVAFLVGFFSYLTLGRPADAVAHERASAAIPTYSDEASWPTSAEWNVGKQI